MVEKDVLQVPFIYIPGAIRSGQLMIRYYVAEGPEFKRSPSYIAVYTHIAFCVGPRTQFAVH
jgi:hypothetical protein